MDEQLTPQQKQAVYDRGGRLLVSAAAGSGKTKVLVDRLMSYLIDPISPANIDDFLIITYTKAAAAELRGKIASKLSEAIAAEADNKHLLLQLQRLHLTQISTVHSFCTNLLRDYAYLLDISGDFRVADEEECIALRIRALDRVLENAYSESTDEDFFAFIDSQGFGRDDRRIAEIILQVYNAAKCHLNPDGWLDTCVHERNLNSAMDLSETIWGQYLIEDLHDYIDLQIATLKRCIAEAGVSHEMVKPAALLKNTVRQLQWLRECNTWDGIWKNRSVDYGRLVFSKKCSDEELISQIKAIRDACKTGLNKKLSVFTDNSETMILDYQNTLKSAYGLVSLVRKFDQEYSRVKRARNVLDFSDLEHFSLDLLLGRHRNGSTQIAREVSARFREVMIDEYQDSNAVQDAIFSALTEQRHNCFMVGDVKQSIYQFRLADPTIFIDKYNRYVPASDAKNGEGRKVVLSQNFRSSGAVIGAVNDVFETCMSPSVGGLNYGEEEALYEGVPHIPLNEPEVEFFGVDVEKDTYNEEAAVVASKIQELLDGQHMVRHGEHLRPIKPEDIVILLRSPGSVGAAYQYALEQRGIRCASGSGMDLLQTEEVETLCSLLQVIDNPLVDIPLVAVLLSRVFGFTADELADIRKNNKYGNIYAALRESKSEKVEHFLEILSDLRKTSQLCSVSKLLMYIFSVTRIDSIFAAMTDGAVRSANLQQFCQLASTFESTSSGGLSGFLNYLEALSVRGITSSTSNQSNDAVTIMSIHKSKGLEFPVVFLCGLSRDFNMENSHTQVLCHKELGLGLSCVDVKNRIQYPSIAKRAIAAKLRAESISEELRVLYVAMTRAKDKLIMTYSVKNVDDDIDEISNRMAFSEPILLTSTASCPGIWVIMGALQPKNSGWKIQQITAAQLTVDVPVCGDSSIGVDDSLRNTIRNSLTFRYAHPSAVSTPSKQTATQIKGREKDKEVAEFATRKHTRNHEKRKPSFVRGSSVGAERGTVMHTVMQFINYARCVSADEIAKEIDRLVFEKYITQQQAQSIDQNEIMKFFASAIGRKVRNSIQVLREFKFSLLTDPGNENPENPADHILLQGIVDCAIIENDGITIIDFKSDRIPLDGIEKATAEYSHQVKAYADALSQIFQLPIKQALLYFFYTATFATVI